MAKSITYNLYADLLNAVETVISTKYIFLKDRPKISDGSAPMAKFAVIDLPVSIEDLVVGNKKRILTTIGVFYLFVQARNNGTLDLNSTGDFTDSIVDLFPIKGEYCSAANPVVRMMGSDEQGFQVVTVTFDLQTKWDAFKQNN